jgi:dihydroflavonol-4-reductase
VVVVTGASGHVGAVLVRELLRRGRKVRALVRRDRRALEGLDIREVRGDVLAPESLMRAFEGAETVYHLAAIISIARKNVEHIRAVNVQGVENVVESCLQRGVKRLVHFSSIHAFSPYPRQETVDESRSLVTEEQLMPYDWSKAEGERTVLRAVQRGLDAVVVNPTAIVGPFDFKLSEIGRFFLSLYHNRIPALVAGGFDWVDVRDVVDGAIAAQERGRTGERYVLSGEWVTVKELSRMVEECTGHRTPRFVAPMWLARLGVPFVSLQSAFTGEKPLFTRGSLHTLRHHRYISHEKASRELGYSPRPLREAVEDAFSWYEDHSNFLNEYPLEVYPAREYNTVEDEPPRDTQSQKAD